MSSPSIAIHGLGYVGLTAAVHFAKAGWDVLGYDPDVRTVDGINHGRPRAGEFLAYLDGDVKALGLRATTRFNEIVDRPVHLVAVPTEKDGKPYDAIVESVILRLAETTQPGTTVLVESTLTPGTMAKLRPQISRTFGEEFFLAVCPRRDWFADPEKNLHTLPRVVGGMTPACTQAAYRALSTVSRHILLTTAETAELTKALENALLHVPVMFAYQLAYALPNADVAEALRLAGTHWRLPSLYLGFGTGGRCVPLGTEYLLAATHGKLELARIALNWDDQFRSLIAHIIRGAGAHNAVVLGMGYRPDFRDMGRSAGLAVAKHLHRLDIPVAVHDPLWMNSELESLTGLRVMTDDGQLPYYDAVLLATPHTRYLDWPKYDARWRRGQLVLDAQGAWAIYRDLFQKAGIAYARVGEPGWLFLRDRHQTEGGESCGSS